MLNFLKKVVVICLVVSMTVGICPALAADSDGLEQAILTAKSKIEVSDEYTEFNSGIGAGEDEVEYYLSWNTEDGQDSIEITINDKGDIINFWKSNNVFDSRPRFAELSKDELSAKALEWISSVNSSWAEQLRYRKNDYINDTNIHSEREYLSFDRYVNGIKFLNDYVSVSISNRTGEILNMSSGWTYTNDFSDGSGVMDTSAALEKYLAVNPLELRYEFADENLAELVYGTKERYILIDAYTGDEVKNYPNASLYGVTEETAQMAAMDSGGGVSNAKVRLSEAELSNLEEIDNLLSEEDLKQKATSLQNTGLDKAVYKSCSFSRGYENEAVYLARLLFVFNEGEEEEYYGNVVFDAQTGELMSYRAYNYYRDEEATADTEKAKEDAYSFIKEYAPEQATKTELSEKDKGDYIFDFTRYENNIPYYDNLLTVEVDGVNGNICSFNKIWDEPEFESPDGVVDIEIAKKFYLDNVGLELVYEYSYTADKKEPDIKVCYRAKNTNSINAKTGEVPQYYQMQEKLYPDDISGHYAEEQITKLINAGLELLTDEGSFMPDTDITYEEFAGWVSQLMYGYFPREAVEMKSMLINNGIILSDEEFAPDAAVLRVDGPVYIIRALGYREVAELPDIYKCSFADEADIPSDKLGYAAIANAMKIVNGDENGSFNPNNTLSRADAAIMIYNYLAR